MNTPESLSGNLRDLVSLFEHCVLWTVRAILEADVVVKAPFEALAEAPDNSSLYCILPVASESHYAQVVVGVQETDLPVLFAHETDEKVRKDAVGELANVLSGLFIGDDLFVSRFGNLRPSTPFFSEGAFTARKDWGLKGKIEVNGREITLQFSIRDLRKGASPAAWESGDNPLNTEGNPG